MSGVELSKVPSVLQAMYEHNQLEFSVCGTMAEDGSIKVTSVNISAKDKPVPKVAGFKGLNEKE